MRYFVIERHIDSAPHYWDGSDWDEKLEGAIRFTRDRDASLTLSRACEGIGRVVEMEDDQ